MKFRVAGFKNVTHDFVVVSQYNLCSGSNDYVLISEWVEIEVPDRPENEIALDLADRKLKKLAELKTKLSSLEAQLQKAV